MNHALHILVFLVPVLIVGVASAQDAELQRRIAAETAARDAAMAAEAAHGGAAAAKEAAIAAQRQAQLDVALKAVGEPRSTVACIVVGQPVLIQPAAAGVVGFHVLRTLDGPDLTGTTMPLLKPGAMEAGRSYLLTLTINPLAEHPRVDSIQEPAAQRIKEITDRAVVSAKRIFWMHRQGVPKDDQFVEFIVAADGAFTFNQQISAARDRPETRRTLAGRIDAQQVEALIKAIESAQEINANAPQGVAAFHWIADDVHRFKLFADFPNRPVADLLAQVTRLAETAGAPATQPAGR